jgi:tetratricopeptide (TPR) repeat protein
MTPKKHLNLILLTLACLSTQAQSKQDSLLARVDVLSEGEELADTYYELSKTYEGTDLELALFWIDKLQRLSKKINYKKGSFNAVISRGKVYYFDKKPDSALVYFQKAFDEKLVTTPIDSADIFNNMGVAYEAKGEIDKALSHLNQALEIYEKLDSDSGLLSILVNMGNCFYEAGNAKQALVYQKKAYKLALALGDSKKIPITILNYSMLSLYVEGDTGKIDSLLNQLKNNPVTHKNPDILSTYYQNMAVFYGQTGQPEKAEQNYELALETALSYSETAAPGIYSGLARLYVKKGEFTKAETYYHQALQSSSKKSEKRLLYLDLARFYTQRNNIDSASAYWEKSMRLMEALEEERIQELSLKSKNNIDLIQKEKEIAILEEQRKRSVLQKQINQGTIFGLLVLLALLGIIAFLFIKHKKKQLQVKKAELKLKNQNLLNLSLQINQKNQVLKDFETNIVHPKTTGESAGLQRAAKKALKQSLKIDEDWKKFELYFNDLYSGFYDKLKNSYPDLTNNELRICSLAKLRFNLKEISQTLFLSVDSVKSARYRIRKKLNLQASDDLSDFLNNL